MYGPSPVEEHTWPQRRSIAIDRDENSDWLQQMRGRRASANREEDKVDRSENSERIIADFEGALAAFDAADPFTGPARYFHLRALTRRNRHASVTAALGDSDLLADIYATLTAWGMHRLGEKGAKLAEFDAFASSLRAAEPKLASLEGARIADRAGDVAALTDAIWALLEGLAVSTRQSQLVAGTKAVHHLLPDLIPPIDRAYTLRCLLGSMAITKSGERQFRAVFPQLIAIAQARKDQIEAAVGRGFHTGTAKTLDNAVIGYTLANIR